MEKIVMPVLLSNVVRQVGMGDAASLRRTILSYLLVYGSMQLLNIVFYKYRSRLVHDLNQSSVSSMIEKISKAEWSVVSNNMLPLVSMMNNAVGNSWRVVNLMTSVVAGHIFTVLGLLYTFYTRTSVRLTAAVCAMVGSVVLVLAQVQGGSTTLGTRG